MGSNEEWSFVVKAERSGKSSGCWLQAPGDNLLKVNPLLFL